MPSSDSGGLAAGVSGMGPVVFEHFTILLDRDAFSEAFLTLGACAKGYSSCLVCLCGRNKFPRLLVAASDSAYRKYMTN